MSDHDALLQSVLDAPADDAPRLVLADWLDENGQADRAAFIRVQIRIDRHNDDLVSADEDCDDPDCQRCAEMKALRHRERALIMAMGKEAVPQFSPGGTWGYEADARRWSMGASLHGTLRRGFVETVTCPGADWVAHGRAVRAVQPVTRVALTSWPELEHVEDIRNRRHEFRLLPGGREVIYIAAFSLQRTNLGIDDRGRPLGITRRLLAAEFRGITFDLLE